MQYIVVKDSSVDDLVDMVNELISQGWVPQGGVSFSHRHSDGSGRYVQALIKQG